MQPAPQWQLSISPEYEREVDTQQYVTTLAGGGPATFGGRYVFAHIDRSTYSTQIRLNYTFKPDLTLDFYGEPFAASGRYDHIGELAAARTRLLRLYGTDGTTLTTLADGSQRVTDGATASRCATATSTCSRSAATSCCGGNGAPGSTLYLVWQQDRESGETLRRSGCRSPTCSARSAGPATTSSPSRASFWFSPR